MVASVCRNRETASSRSVCRVWVPQMKRTDAMPNPHRSSASLAAAMRRGSSASPR